MLSDHHQIIDVTSIEGYFSNQWNSAPKYADDFAEHSQLMLYDDSQANTAFIGRTDQFSWWAFKYRASEPAEVGVYSFQRGFCLTVASHRAWKRTALARSVDLEDYTTQTVIVKGIVQAAVAGSTSVAYRRWKANQP